MNVAWARLPECPGLAHALLRDEVARCCGVNPHEVRLAVLCGRCGSHRHGKPYVLPIRDVVAPQVSLSRAEGVAIVAVTHAGPVGVDIERTDALSFPGFDTVALHPDERAGDIRDRATTWVRKEALLKATGDGLLVDPRTIHLSDPGVPPRLVEWAADNAPGGGVWMFDIDVGAAYRAGLAVLSDRRPDLSVREADREDLPHEAMRGRAHPEPDPCEPLRSR